MEIIFLLIGVSLSVALVFLWLFLRSIKTGQFEDMHTPAIRILFDNTLKNETETEDGESRNSSAAPVE